jgi:hypothetical protein
MLTHHFGYFFIRSGVSSGARGGIFDFGTGEWINRVIEGEGEITRR